MPRLRRVDCSEPGITRRRRGRGFEFLDEAGNRVTDETVLSRIAELAIPPAWEKVWICRLENGHLQATGIDDAGRKQYLYHERWRARRDAQKYDAMLEFARALPRLRRRVTRDLRRDDEITRDRVLACAARLLDLGFFRVGSEDYAERNESYGLATILKEHVVLQDEWIVFDYPAKSGQRRIQAIADDDVDRIVRALKSRRGGGPELLAYKGGGRWRDLKSDEINEYLKEVTRGDFTAKDFRTWNASVLAAIALAAHARDATSKTSRKRAVSAAIKTVAAYLGNTPAVCRASYVDPRVIDRFHSGWTIKELLDELGGEADMSVRSHRTKIESAVLDLLEERRSSPALEKSTG